MGNLKDILKQYDSQFTELYNALSKLINSPQGPKKRIGFKSNDL